MKLLRAKKGNEQRDFDLPETADDLTWGQAIKLIQIEQDDPDAMLKTVEAMTGIEAEWWRDTTESNKFIEVAIQCQHFMIEWAKSYNNVDGWPLVNPIEIDGGMITLPEDVGKESTGQYWDALTYQANWRKKQDSEEGATVAETFDLYEKVFRIYAQPSMSNNSKYDAGKAMTMDISNAKFKAVLGWAYFFLTNQARLKNGTQTNVLKARTQTKKSRRGFRKFLNSLAFWQRSTN